MVSAGALGIYLLFTIPICWYDLRYRRVPDLLTYPALLLLGIYQLFFGNYAVTALIPAAGGACGILWITRMLSKGGIGWGDLKLGMLNALLLPPWLWLPALALGCGAALLIYLPFYAAGRIGRNYRIPFAPFLAGGAAAIKLLQAGGIL